MVARREAVVQNLSSHDDATKLKALRDVKNQIIGNKQLKLSYIKLGAVPRIVDLLSSPAETVNIRVQSAATVGSFAYGVEDGVRAVLASGGIEQLLQTLCSDNAELTQAAARSLKMVYQSTLAPKTHLFESPALQCLVGLLSSQQQGVAEVAARVLARCCETKSQQDAIAAAGGLEGLLQLLHSGQQVQQAAAVEGMAALTANNPHCVAQVLGSTELLLAQLKQPAPRTRFLACTTLTNLTCCCPEGSEPPSPEVARAVLPVLVKLLRERALAQEAPWVLSALIQDSSPLQALACDADAVGRLAALLAEEADECHEQQQKQRQGQGGGGARGRVLEGVLGALAQLCMPQEREDARRQLVEAKVLGPIVRALEDESAGVRAAACRCVRSLSRSVKDLRSRLVEAEVALPLFRLLSDACPTVLATASATVCNMLLDFSPIKELLVGEGEAGGGAGCLGRLVELAAAMAPELRLNAVWALQNLAFKAPARLKATLLRHLPWPTLLALSSDPELDIKEKAVNLLRNLIYGEEADIAQVAQWSGQELLPLLQRLLDPAQHHMPGVREQALWCLCNIAAGSEGWQSAVMATELPALLAGYLGDEAEAVRIAALWCVINLSLRDSNGDTAAWPARLAALQALGLEAALQRLAADPSQDVRERAATALDYLKASDTPMDRA